ncbi:MAG: AI-2E family transporter [Deltaproteobacteria bacterium]|nr:AI-2E family transporter [Deltaproteobacteria bacterium]
MILDTRPYSFDRVVRMALGAGLIWAVITALGYLSDVLIPFAVALLLAYIMNPVVHFIQRYVRNRGVAIGLTLLVFVVVLIGLFWIVVPLMGREVAHMGRLISDLVSNSKLAEAASKRLPPDVWQALREYFNTPEVQNFFRTDSFISMVQTALRKLLPGLMGIISGTYSVIMALIVPGVVFMYLIFLLLDFQKVRVVWKEMIPDAYRDGVIAFVEEFDLAMNQYFRGQIMISGVLCIVFAAGFSMIGLPLGILLGIMLGIMTLVPYLQILGAIPAVMVAAIHALETGQSFWVVLGLTGLVFVVAQIVQDVILVPRILGKAMGLSPAVMLLSLSIWGKLLGMLGLLIALPMTCLVLAYYRRLVLKQEVAVFADGAET